MKVKKIFGVWFWAWASLAATMVITMFLFPAWKETCSSIIMSSMFMMPIRNWCQRLIRWWIDYYSSINSEFKSRINPFATYNKLLDDDDTRSENIAFYRGINLILLIVSSILALIFLIFKKCSFQCVFSVLHTFEFIVRGKISPVALLFYILITITFFILLWFFFKEVVVNGIIFDVDGKIIWKKALIIFSVALVGFYGKIIVSALLLNYMFNMIVSSVIFWTIILIVSIITLVLIEVIMRNRSSS